MSQHSLSQPVAVERPALPTVSVRELLPYLAFGALILLMALYFIGAEQGATSLVSGSSVHEFLHDARHLLGFPCH